VSNNNNNFTFSGGVTLSNSGNVTFNNPLTVKEQIAESIKELVKLNKMSDIEQILTIGCDKEAYHQISEPSETVTNFYKFTYEL